LIVNGYKSRCVGETERVEKKIEDTEDNCCGDCFISWSRWRLQRWTTRHLNCLLSPFSHRSDLADDNSVYHVLFSVTSFYYEIPHCPRELLLLLLFFLLSVSFLPSAVADEGVYSALTDTW